jgi:site-specific recombinase XerD
MATVYILKHETQKGHSYTVKYYDPLTKKKKYYKTFKKFRIAQQKANELRSALDTGKVPKNKKTKLVPLAFNQVSASLRDEWTERLRIKELSQKTHDEYGYRLNVLEREFGEDLLCQISKTQIKKYLGNVAESFTNITANRSLSVLRKVFEHGTKKNAVISDPTISIKFLSEKEHERNNFLLPQQIDELVEASQKTRAKFYMPAIILLGAEHGASKQEILCLKWSDIDFEFMEKGLIKLYRTKNKKKRTELLMPRTKQALLGWKEHLEYMRKRTKVEIIKSDYVFCRLDGTRIKCFNRAWWHALKLAGIRKFHFHDLRHTFCSNLLMAGSGLKDAKEMIGHSNISMTDRYSHLTTLHKIEQQDRLAEYYQNYKI